LGYIYFPTPTPIFPALASVGWSVHKKPIMASRVAIASTGREVQLACAAYPRWSFILSYDWLREQTQNITPDGHMLGFTELEQLSGLFLLCKGSYGEFYFEDPDDNSRRNQTVAWPADNVTSTFLLFYNWGYGPFNPPLRIPVGGIKSIDAVYFDGTVQSPSIYFMDPTNTALSFTAPPPGGTHVTADFHFYFRCRFLDDHLDFSQFAQNRWEAKEVRFESVKP
jgi:hypothetical protein